MDKLERLQRNLDVLNSEKNSLVRSMAKSPELADDFKSSIESIKSELEELQFEIAQASNIEDDFEQFMEFALNYADNIKQNWWEITNPQDRIRFKQLVYIDGIQVSRQGKVLTPHLSPIYRYETSKKTSVNASLTEITSNGGTDGA